MNIVDRIDSEIEKRSLLKHPFYQMWSEGKLTLDHLQGYSKEYFQLVKAVPSMVKSIAGQAAPSTKSRIIDNAREEADHVEPWIRFAFSLGVPRSDLDDYQAGPKTIASLDILQTLTGTSFEQAAAAMYAYEAELPKISRSKIEGLKKFYHIDSEDSTKYFEIHEEADVRHSQLWREILMQIPAERQDAAFHAAVESLKAQHMILDSVQEKYGIHC